MHHSHRVLCAVYVGVCGCRCVCVWGGGVGVWCVVVTCVCGWLLMQVLDEYNDLLAQLRTHRDWIDGVERTLAALRQTPLTDNVDRLQHQLTNVQVCLCTCTLPVSLVSAVRRTHCYSCASSFSFFFWRSVFVWFRSRSFWWQQYVCMIAWVVQMCS